jgi:hypothetical protein
VGVYENAKGDQRYITVEEGRLYLQRKGKTRFELKRYNNGPDDFFFEGSLARIRFEKENTGAQKVTQAKFSDRKQEGEVWKKVDKPLPSQKAQVAVKEADLDKLLGEYQLAHGFNIAVTREGTQLFCQATGQQRFEVCPESVTRFFSKSGRSHHRVFSRC